MKIENWKLKIFFVLALLLPQTALAMGVGVNPSEFSLDFRDGKEAEAVSMEVINISEESGYFEVYADELSNWIQIEPSQFFLEAHARKNISLFIQPKENGSRATNISVVARPLESKRFRAASGVKISLKMSVEGIGDEKMWNWLRFSWLWFLALFVLIVGTTVLLFGFWHFYHKRLSWKQRILGLDFLRRRWK